MSATKLNLLPPLLLLLLSQLLCAGPALAQSYYDNVLLDTLELLRRGQQYTDAEALDERVPPLSSYDFIVVGAGTAGCALAARLSENPKWQVLLLEAGGPENYGMDMPILTHYLQLGEMNWKYRTQPSQSYCLAMNDHRCNWPRGKVMGGSSVLNYMMYTRGNRRDYDQWAALGNAGWSYKDVLPYFKKYEGSSVPDAEPDYVGRQGPVRISYADRRTRIADAYVQASQQTGMRQGDYNGRQQLGVSYLQATVYNGTRWSANRAYLHPLKGRRPNLHIWKRALVTRVLIEAASKRAMGVAVRWRGEQRQVRARREVILSAGAINTPQLLMLSGVGPAKHLRRLGIKPLADLAVGYNLQDHIAPAVSLLTNASSLQLKDMLSPTAIGDYLRGQGTLRIPGGVEAISFYALDAPQDADGWADLELFLVSGGIHTNVALRLALGIRPDIYRAMFAELERKAANGFMIFPMILRPKSRGRIKLQSTDPAAHPLIYANYLSHPYDMNITIRGIQKALELLQQPAFKAINARRLPTSLPACRRYDRDSREFWECHVRHFTFTIYHYSGTARMGPPSDRTAVVDPRLRVYGIKGLRVVDASIMPYLVAGHPNGPVFLIAEKAADMIKQDHNYVAT